MTAAAPDSPPAGKSHRKKAETPDTPALKAAIAATRPAKKVTRPSAPDAAPPAPAPEKTVTPARAAPKKMAKNAGKSVETPAPPAAAPIPAKPRKARLTRDSFTMPEEEYAGFQEIKKRCLAHGSAVKKSEILRAALAGFAGLSDAELVAAIQRLAPIKTGRPSKAHK